MTPHRGTARQRDIVGRRLTAVAANSGRDAASISSHLDERPVLLLPGAVLHPVGRRTLGQVEVTLYTEAAASRPGGAPEDVESLWAEVAAALRQLPATEVRARIPNPFFSGDLA